MEYLRQKPLLKTYSFCSQCIDFNYRKKDKGLFYYFTLINGEYDYLLKLCQMFIDLWLYCYLKVTLKILETKRYETSFIVKYSGLILKAQLEIKWLFIWEQLTFIFLIEISLCLCEWVQIPSKTPDTCHVWLKK